MAEGVNVTYTLHVSVWLYSERYAVGSEAGLSDAVVAVC